MTSQQDRLALTVFRGRAGDHNDRGGTGASLLGAAVADHWDVEPVVVGVPERPLSTTWDVELDAARPGLRALRDRVEQVLRSGRVPVTLLTRCACALATVPVVARHRPDAVVVWFDAHADLNTPDGSATGYLGGMALSGPLGRWDSGLGAGLRSAVLVGARDVDDTEQPLIDDGTVPNVMVGPDAPARLRALVAGRPVYVHVDCDVLEPGLVPTDYAVPQGLSFAALHELMIVLAEHEVVGLEVGELQGEWDDGSPADVTGLLDALAPVLVRLARGRPEGT